MSGLSLVSPDLLAEGHLGIGQKREAEQKVSLRTIFLMIGRNRTFRILFALVSAVLVSTIVLLRFVIRPCFMVELSNASLIKITYTLSHSQGVDKEANKALTELLAVPINCPQRYKIDNYMAKLACGIDPMTANERVKIDPAVRDAIFESLIPRIKTDKTEDKILTFLASNIFKLDPVEQHKLNQFVSNEWAVDNGFRSRLQNILSSTSDDDVAHYLASSLNDISAEKNEEGKAANKALSDLTSSPNTSPVAKQEIIIIIGKD